MLKTLRRVLTLAYNDVCIQTPIMNLEVTDFGDSPL